MEVNGAVTTRKMHLIRFAVWAQSIGYVLMAASALFILIGPSSSRFGAGDFILPALALIGMHLFGLDRRIALVIPRGLLAVLALCPSVAVVGGTTMILHDLYSTTRVLSPLEVTEQKFAFAFFLAYHIAVSSVTLLLVRKTFVASREAPPPKGP